MPITQRQARQEISKLIEKSQAMPESSRQSITKVGVVHQFLDPLLRASGWPVDDSDRYKYELHTYGGRLDMTLLPEQGGVVYVDTNRELIERFEKKIEATLARSWGKEEPLEEA